MGLPHGKSECAASAPQRFKVYGSLSSSARAGHLCAQFRAPIGRREPTLERPRGEKCLQARMIHGGGLHGMYVCQHK